MRTITLTTVFALMLVSAPAFGQSNYAYLSGTILDPQNRVLAGASVQLTSLSTRAARRVSSNDQGIFSRKSGAGIGHNPRRFATNQFQNIRILLVRHDAGAGAKRIGQVEEVELRCCPQHPFLGPTA